MRHAAAAHQNLVRRIDPLLQHVNNALQVGRQNVRINEEQNNDRELKEEVENDDNEEDWLMEVESHMAQARQLFRRQAQLLSRQINVLHKDTIKTLNTDLSLQEQVGTSLQNVMRRIQVALQLLGVRNR